MGRARGCEEVGAMSLICRTHLIIFLSRLTMREKEETAKIDATGFLGGERKAGISRNFGLLVSASDLVDLPSSKSTK